jgi:UDPglucose 6-dehydrogenase
MKISMIGTGYVGLVTGTCFSEFGFDVTCVDKIKDKIDFLNKGKVPIYEPGLEAIIEKNVKAKRLRFTTDLATSVKKSDVVFIAVGTPTREEDGHADLTYVFSAAEDIAKAMDGYTVIVTKSTVPVDTAKKIEQLIKKINPNAKFDVVSNPEFLREGSAVEDFMRPDRVVVGARTEKAKEVMKKLYRPLFLLETPIIFTTPESSELIKYASNSFLATKVAFINQIADLCEKCGADIQDVATGVGLDGRIGKKFLHTGPGYGGSCFPKDTLALVKTAQKYQCPTTIVESVIEANDARKKRMGYRIIEACGGNIKGKTIGILGVTFKPNTDDMRDSPSLDIIPILQQNGAKIKAYDPAGMKEAKSYFKDVKWQKNEYDTIEGTDCTVILTEWNEFRSLDKNTYKTLAKKPLIVDLRNIYPLQEMKDAGIEYISLGRKHIK